MDAAKRYHFSFLSSYQGACDYKVVDFVTREEHRVSHRTSLSDYLKKHYNATPEVYERDVVGGLYYLTDTCGKMTPEIVEAFREYMQAEADQCVIDMRALAAKYEDDPEIKSIYDAYGPNCPLIRGGAVWNQGWVAV